MRETNCFKFYFISRTVKFQSGQKRKLLLEEEIIEEEIVEEDESSKSSIKTVKSDLSSSNSRQNVFVKSTKLTETKNSIKSVGSLSKKGLVGLVKIKTTTKNNEAATSNVEKESDTNIKNSNSLSLLDACSDSEDSE